MSDFVDNLIELAKATAQKKYDEDPEITYFSWISGEEFHEFTLSECYIELNAVVGITERKWHEDLGVWLWDASEEYQDRDFGVYLALSPESGWFVVAVEEI